MRRLDISRKVRIFAEMKGEATVVKNAGSHYLLSCLPEWDLFPAVLRGRIRLKGSSATNPVAVGDRVSWEADDDARPTPEHPATITSVHERRNYVIRRSTNLSRQAHVIAANVDEAFIIVSLYFPEIKLPFLDRILLLHLLKNLLKEPFLLLYMLLLNKQLWRLNLC